eukprot:CAMPEP_0116913832 /NCGR_PEP_ID=MMETSP0467-20121206/16944_1 /TAXON_ID=283647 /ORGANISM="Mesodinium pulex, Strain SPMC105" /LENGTH=200 /DNA_ID=CAMNT_0004590133 /DNA_START=644 /DNA_END=1248 /DNA_ORIENTATION=+
MKQKSDQESKQHEASGGVPRGVLALGDAHASGELAGKRPKPDSGGDLGGEGGDDTAQEEFKFRYWADASIDIEKMVTKTKVLRLVSTKKMIYFDSRTEKKHNYRYNKFRKHHTRDVHQSFTTSLDIDGFESEILSSDHDYWWLSYSLWILCSLLFINFLQEWYFLTLSRKYKYPVLKMVSYKKRMDKDKDDSDCSNDSDD